MRYIMEHPLHRGASQHTYEVSTESCLNAKFTGLLCDTPAWESPNNVQLKKVEQSPEAVFPPDSDYESKCQPQIDSLMRG